MSILCPHCKNSSPSRTVLALEVPIKAYKISLSEPMREHVYRCPRCKGQFSTMEKIGRVDNYFIPKKEDLDRYDERVKRGEQPPRQPVSNNVQHLILKTFSEDILEDIDKDRQELSEKKNMSK